MGAGLGLFVCLFACPLVAGGQALGVVLSFRGVLPAFCPLCGFACGTLCLNMALFRILRAFLARFMGFVWVCMAWVLCVACVALYACGVRRFWGLWRVCLSFSPFIPVFALVLSFFVLLFVLVSLCLLLLPAPIVFCLSSCLVVSFSLTDYTQKERAQFFAPSLLVLWVCL